MADTQYVPRMKQLYDDVARAKLLEEYKYSNAMEVPQLEKVVLNMGLGEGTQDRKAVEKAAEQLTLIAGQKAQITIARKSIATFKLRDGMSIGAKVTLRGMRMYEFVDRLVTVALPRVRDFRGLRQNSFDGRGNFALGIKEHIVFTEIDYDSIDSILGLDVVICTTAKNDDEARTLLKELNFPFSQ